MTADGEILPTHPPTPATAVLHEDHARQAAAIFKALGDPTRVKILHALLHGEHTVTDLTTLVGDDETLTLSAVSHQLRLLRSLRIVRDRREGKQIYYSLDDEHIAAMLRLTLAHIGHD